MGADHCGLLIVGAGHAGSELAVSARQAGWTGPITLLGDEASLPYHRPPLSKAYLQGTADPAALALRSAEAYDKAGVQRRHGLRVVAVDRAGKAVALDDGTRLRFDKLAWCAGGRPRPWTVDGIDPGKPPINLCYLRSLVDADHIRAGLGPGKRLVVVGGGYVGLETAATARKLGSEVTVIEAQPRVLARVAGEPVSKFYETVHRDAGVRILTNTAVARVQCEPAGNGAARIIAVSCTDGTSVPADFVVVGIGMLPNVEPLLACGLAESNGVPVDEHGCTADPDVVAAGDCTFQFHTVYGRRLRLESVPNALEQARAAASWLAGKPKPVHTIPWFWSDQYDLKLQMAGLSQGFDRCVLRGDPATRSFCAFYLKGSRLLAVDAVNRLADFMLVRRALAQAPELQAERLADESLPLKDLLAASA